MIKNEAAYWKGRQDCKAGKIPSDGMCDEYWEGYSKELARTELKDLDIESQFNEIFEVGL